MYIATGERALCLAAFKHMFEKGQLLRADEFDPYVEFNRVENDRTMRARKEKPSSGKVHVTWPIIVMMTFDSDTI